MAKESSKPKAINIVRPTPSINTAPKFQVFSPLRNNAKPPSDIHKPKVKTTAQISLTDRPGLALFAPSQKHNREPHNEAHVRQSVSPPKRIPPVILSTNSLHSGLSSAYQPKSHYVNRTSTTASSQVSNQSANTRASSVVSVRSDASVGLASIHADAPRRLSNSHPQIFNSTMARRPPGILISSNGNHNDFEDQARNVHTMSRQSDIVSRHPYDAISLSSADKDPEPTLSDIFKRIQDEDSSYESREDDLGDDSNASDALDDNQDDDEEIVDEDDGSPVNEARVNRKIADLEISNQSLLAVNAMLESTVRKQAAQIANLKRASRSTEINELPKSNLEDTEIDTLITNEEDDEQFQRITTIIDRLIEEAQASVEYKISHGGRVLSQYDQSEIEDELSVASNNTVSLSGLNTDQDALRGLNLRSPLTTRSQQRRQSSLARQHGNSLSEGSAPTMNDVRSTKSTAILPISPQSPKMPARKVASAESLATSHNQQMNNRRSKPRTSRQGRVYV